MNGSMKIGESRKKLRAACDAFIKSGGTIVAEVFSSSNKKCCPMTILVKGKHGNSTEKILDKACKALACEKMFIFAFIGGMDDRLIDTFAKKYHRAFNLGLEFRKRYVEVK